MVIMSATGADVTRSDVLQVLRDTTERFLTATEIADSLDTDRQRVNYRLKKLHENNEVEKKKAGSRAVGWWVPED